MTPLRQQMIEAMRQRGFSPRTHQSYLGAVSALAQYYRRSPAKLSVEELQGYFNYLAQERGLSAASGRLSLNAVRFLYAQVLQWPSFDVPLVVPKRPQRIPELLTRADVGRIIEACTNPKHRLLLELCYGCGLRVSELVSVRVRDIDAERGLLRIEQGKGAKDRLVIVSATLLERLRAYCTRHRAGDWVFAQTRNPRQALSISSAPKIFGRAKRKAGIDKTGGIHGLRHAYATHQIENGLAVHQLQRLLGHGSLQSTMRYLHWMPGAGRDGRGHRDLLAELGVRHD